MYKQNVYAQFGIEKKRSEKGVIVELLVHRREADNSLTKLGWYPRDSIISHIEKGYTYMTVSINYVANQWQKGEDVHVVTVRDGRKYLRTDANQISGDNLDNIPEG